MYTLWLNKYNFIVCFGCNPIRNDMIFFFFSVGIEAADLTSLLEQFEETQGNQ